jgi:hypothetical protein
VEERELSDLNIQRKQCERCGATWLNGVHMWRTGYKGNELDLAGLVCNTVNDPKCINPLKGEEGGDTWELRRAFISAVTQEMKLHKPKN